MRSALVKVIPHSTPLQPGASATRRHAWSSHSPYISLSHQHHGSALVSTRGQPPRAKRRRALAARVRLTLDFVSFHLLPWVLLKNWIARQLALHSFPSTRRLRAIWRRVSNAANLV